jgi:hypothetical protein
MALKVMALKVIGLGKIHKVVNFFGYLSLAINQMNGYDKVQNV